MKNTCLEADMNTRIKVLNNYHRKLERSGYKLYQSRRILVAGLQGYERIVTEAAKKGSNINRDSCEGAVQRYRAKYLARASWFLKSAKGKDNPKPNKKTRKVNMKSQPAVKSVLFLPKSDQSLLLKQLQENEKMLKEVTNEAVRYVERGGRTVRALLHVADPWQGLKCGRRDCLLCETPAQGARGEAGGAAGGGGGQTDRRQSCFSRGIIYQTYCTRCGDVKHTTDDHLSEREAREKQPEEEAMVDSLQTADTAATATAGGTGNTTPTAACTEVSTAPGTEADTAGTEADTAPSTAGMEANTAADTTTTNTTKPGPTFVYVGTSHLSAYERGFQHIADLRKEVPDTHQIGHARAVHGGEHVQFGMRVVKRPRTVFTRLIGEACMIRQQANKENVILLNARSELSLMVLPKLSLVRYQDSGQDQGAVKGEEKNEKSPEQVPEVVPFPSNNNDSNESTTKVKMKFSDIKSKRTTAKEKGGADRSIIISKNKYKQTKISDMVTKLT